MLIRREIENYLFDKELLKLHCTETGFEFDEEQYDSLVSDIDEQDLKPLFSDLLKCCTAENIGKEKFCLKLVELATPDTGIYNELNEVIFR